MTRALILAAGSGTRMGELTRDRPKGLLPVNGQPLVAHQINNLRKTGIDDITIIAGYLAEKFAGFNAEVVTNPEYATTNMVASMICAQDHFQDAGSDLLVHYGDVIIEPRHLKSLVDDPHDIACLVDVDWVDYFRARGEHWRDDIEALRMDEDRRIREIGGAVHDLDRIQGRFVGALKFSGAGARSSLGHYRKMCEGWPGSPQKAKAVRLQYTTDFLQSMISSGIPVYAHTIERGWLEFDCRADYETAMAWVNARNFQFLDGDSALDMEPGS